LLIGTFFHAFRDCVKVKDLWVQFGVSGQQSFFKNLNWIDWLFENLKDVKLVRNAQWRMADRLAKHGLSLNVKFKIFNFVPGFISLELFVDNACVTFLKGFEVLFLKKKLGLCPFCPKKKKTCM
jgi:hypothetical protein